MNDREGAGEIILITGAAGNIGSQMRRRLARPNRLLRLLDTAGLPDPEADESVEVIQESVTNLSALEAACAHADAVIHLGGHSREAPWPDILATNIGGTYNVFEAARRASVPRVIFASSSHAVGYSPIGKAASATALFPRPDTNYGVGKVAGEAIGSLYADRYGLQVICIRIGVSFGAPGAPEFLGSWLSPADCARLLEACLSTSESGYRVIWGASNNTRLKFNLDEAIAIGYRPEDDSEVYAEDIRSWHGDLSAADSSSALIGGTWCGPEFDTARLNQRDSRDE